jgi:DNA-binding response OmpR family regulator
MGQLIFVVDGELEVCQLAKECLEAAGYSVRTFLTGDIMAQAEASRPALILIALMLADGGGLALCRQLRQNPVFAETAVVFLLNDALEEHRILALEAGGDDCVMKPFSPRELVARVQAVLRRFGLPGALVRADSTDLVIDSGAMKLSVRGTEVPTTTLEFRLIEYLARHRGRVFTRDLLLDAVWGDMQFITPRSVDACIRRIREKIEPDRAKPTLLKTIRGVGYRLDAIAAWQSASNEQCGCVACTTKASAGSFHGARVKRPRPAAET